MTNTASPPPRKLLVQLRESLRVQHYSIRTVQELLGHKACPERSRRDVKTTMIYTHVLQRGGLVVRSPLDA